MPLYGSGKDLVTNLNLESFLKTFDQAKFWKPNQTTSTWVFLCLNDGEFVNLVNAQAICFVLCYIQAIILIIFFL
jgi:hypothetical protein